MMMNHQLLTIITYLMLSLFANANAFDKLIVIRAQLMEAPIPITVTSNETNIRFKPPLIPDKNFCRPLIEIKSVC